MSLIPPFPFSTQGLPGTPLVKIEQSKDEESYILHITRATSRQVNELRIALTTKVSGVAIDRVAIEINSSEMLDEVIAFRINLIPIDIPINKLKLIDEELNSENTLKFSLSEICIGPELHYVYSGDLVWESLEGQDESYRPNIIYDDILLAVLSPGQQLKLTAYAIQGTSSTHSKFSPIRNVYYKDDGRVPPTFTFYIELLHHVDIRQAIEQIPDVLQLEYVE